MPGKDNGGEGLSVFDSIVLVASVRAYGLVGEAIGKVEERLSPRSGELGRVCWRQDDIAGQLWDFELRGWSVVSESVFYFRYVSGVGKFSTAGRAFYSRCE